MTVAALGAFVGEVLGYSESASMRSGTALACGAAAAAGAAYLLYRMASKSAAPALPVTLPDKQGNTVVVRLATPDDLEAVKTRIADHTGTGSGTGGDDFLIQEFRKNVVDPNYTVLFAETAAGVGLGMTIIAWSGRSMMGGAGQSYWQSLRVAQDSRGRGIAALLFKLSARFAIERQGPKSVSRWGIVSNNEIMMTWSKKMNLHGPEAFRRYGAPASDSVVALPVGYTMRPANNDAADRALILRHAKTLPIATSKFGTQNFLRVGWGELTEVNSACRHAHAPPLPPPPARAAFGTPVHVN